jgi:hypothetical protein
VRRARVHAILRLAVAASIQANTAYASAPPAPESAGTADNLQSPDQVNTRYSAYSLPAREWSIEVGALGVGGGDIYALLGVAYGIGAGVQVNFNLAHIGVGLFNASAGYHFLDTRYFDLGAELGAWYGHGKWFWIADPVEKKIISNLDVVNLPVELTASSMPTHWLEFDLSAHYSYAKIFRSSENERSFFTDSELGMPQFFLRPGVRFFILDRTAFEFFAKLPLYSALGTGSGTTSVPFKETWSMEGGLRSRLARGVFGNIRLHYGSIADLLYGARIYPAFEVEVRP